jgi:uncharacterized protein YegP (UPF0339 family)
MAARFTIKKSGDQFVFSLSATNGQTILTSERYVKKASATSGVQSVKTNAPVDARYEKRASKSNQLYFVLKAANSEIIGTSEMYSSEAARDGGIASVKTNAPTAELVDQAT